MATPDKSLRLKTIFLVGGISMCQPFVVDPYLPSIPAVAQDLGANLSVIQLTLAVLTLGLSIGQFVAGPLSDSIGRKKPLLTAVAAYVIAGLLCAWAPTVEVFFAGRVLQGISSSALTVIGAAIMRDLYTGLPLLKLMGRVMLVAASAWFIGPFMGSWLLQFTNWRGISAGIAVFGLIVGLLTIRFMPETLHQANRRSQVFAGMGKRFIKVLKDRSYTGLLVIQMLISLSMFAYLSVLPIVFRTGYGVPAESVGMFIAVNSVGAYTGIQVATVLSKKIQTQWIATGALVLFTLSGLAMFINSVTAPNLWFTAAMSFLFIFAFGNTATTINTMALSAHGAEAGTAAALLGTLGYISSTLAGPFYTTLPKDSASGVGLTIAIAMGLSLVVMFAVVRPGKMKSLS